MLLDLFQWNRNAPTVADHGERTMKIFG